MFCFDARSSKCLYDSFRQTIRGNSNLVTLAIPVFFYSIFLFSLSFSLSYFVAAFLCDNIKMRCQTKWFLGYPEKTGLSHAIRKSRNIHFIISFNSSAQNVAFVVIVHKEIERYNCHTDEWKKMKRIEFLRRNIKRPINVGALCMREGNHSKNVIISGRRHNLFLFFQRKYARNIHNTRRHTTNAHTH